MTNPDELYRPPTLPAEVASERLSKAEWVYAAKVFGLATALLAILSGVVLTWQLTTALGTFGAEGRVAGIVAVSTMREVAKINVSLAAYISMVLMMHQRQKTNTPPPRHGIVLPIFFIVPIVTPIAGILATTTSVVFLVIAYERALDGAWSSIRNTFVFFDAIIGMAMAGAGSLVLAAIAPDLLRLSNRIAGWPILKCFIAAFVVGVVYFLVGNLLYPIVYANELQGVP